MACAKHHLKEKQKIYNAAHYKNNKEAYQRSRNNQRKQAKDFIISKKTKCARCPESFPRCLEFHHMDGKEFSVSRGPTRGMSPERIQREIDKCILLCANCHRKETYLDEFEIYMRLR